MHARFIAQGSGAAGDNMQFGIFLGDDDIVHILGKFRFGEIQAGLHRHCGFYTRQRADKIAVILPHFHTGGVFIRVHRYRFPVIIA